jgi:putative tRNA adenosine deaminase-associated protein
MPTWCETSGGDKVSYFTAVLARDGDKWLPKDLEVEEMTTLAEVTDALRLSAHGDEPVLLLVEREDAWWAVVRADGDEDPRVFVSDTAGVASSRFVEVLVPVDDLEDVLVQGTTCAGDVDLLADLGTAPEDLRELCEEDPGPMDALAKIAEAAGFAEVLDSLR